jgi:indole-3-glycerol phosphate synthase / phosphoribosylanthranilate isomerase
LPTLTETQVDYFLLDCQVGQQTGGTGQAFDWQLLDAVKDKSKLILAGGLNAENVQTAAHCQLAMLDLNSGLESAPGIKDPQKITQIFSLLRQY